MARGERLPPPGSALPVRSPDTCCHLTEQGISQLGYFALAWHHFVMTSIHGQFLQCLVRCDKDASVPFRQLEGGKMCG